MLLTAYCERRGDYVDSPGMDFRTVHHGSATLETVGATMADCGRSVGGVRIGHHDPRYHGTASYQYHGDASHADSDYHSRIVHGIEDDTDCEYEQRTICYSSHNAWHHRHLADYSE